MGRTWLLWCVAAMTLFAACGRRAPSAPSPPSVPNFQGNLAGSYVINSCSEAGVFLSGFCVGSRSNAGGVFQLELSLVQNQTAVSGTVVLSHGGGTPIRGPFQGTIEPSGHLIGSATLEPLRVGQTVTRNITAWDTTITGDSLAGGFTLVYSVITETSTMTVNTTLLPTTRR
jgi:hypothetical protein